MQIQVPPGAYNVSIFQLVNFAYGGTPSIVQIQQRQIVAGDEEWWGPSNGANWGQRVIAAYHTRVCADTTCNNGAACVSAGITSNAAVACTVTASQAAFYRCTATHNGDTLYAHSGQYCCSCNGSSCAFSSGTCSAPPSAGGEQIVAGPVDAGDGKGLVWGRDWYNQRTRVSYTATCPSGGNAQNCQDGGGNACHTTGSNDAPDDLSGTWLCENMVDDAFSTSGYYICDETTVGKTLLSTGVFRYCCLQEPNCVFKFVINECQDIADTSSDTRCRWTNGTVDCSDPVCSGAVEDPVCSERYLGGPSGNDWTERTHVTSDPVDEGYQCSPLVDTDTQCTGLANWNTGTFAINQSASVPSGTRWLCSNDPTGLAAWYLCTESHRGQRLEGKCCVRDPADDSLKFVQSSHPQFATECATAPTCSDSIQNQGETGIDCGGPCAACAPVCNGCLIGTVCYPTGYTMNECRVCTGNNRWVLSDAACNDGSSCTRDFCDPAKSPVGSCSYEPVNTSCLNGLCSNGLCIPCDEDGDGVNKIHPFCSNPLDCNDASASVYPNAEISFCRDTLDNDCPGNSGYGEVDYDGVSGTTKGDFSCPVGVTAISVDTDVSTYGACAQDLTITCTANPGSVRSISATLGGIPCEPDEVRGWYGQSYDFTCDLSLVPDGTHEARCYVDTARSYAVSGQESRTADVDVQCRTSIEGHVTASDGTVISGAIVTAVGSDTTDVSGFYSIGNVPFGNGYDVTVEAPDGYYDAALRNVRVDERPEEIDFVLDPWQCTSDCTFGEMNRCDYTCLGDGGCTIDLVDPADRQRFMDVCGAGGGAINGTQRDFNATHIANCCLGPIEPKGNYETELTLKSCADQLIPHTTLVNHNGKIHRLTVLAYKKCN